MENRYMGALALSWAKLLSEEVEVVPSITSKVQLEDGNSLLLEEGKPSRIPRWMANKMSRGVQVREKEPDVKEFSTAAWVEQNDQKNLKKVDPLIYARASLWLSSGERKELRASLSELLSVRRRKVIEAALSNRQDQAFYAAMTLEERMLYEDLRRSLDQWQEMLSSVLSGLVPGGEVL